MLRLVVLVVWLLRACAHDVAKVLDHGLAIGPPPPTTSLVVTVRDHQGLELPYVEVTVYGAGEDGRDLSGRTDSRGAVRFIVVPGRIYTVSINLGGFTDVTVEGSTSVELRTKKRLEPNGIF